MLSMEELVPTLIELFGTISAIVIAFLILLYESSKRWIDRAKQNLLFELDNCLDCRKVKGSTGLNEGHSLYDQLRDEHKHKQVNSTHIEELLVILNSIINDLRNKDIQNISSQEAGERAKNASHIETNHKRDIEKAYETYKSANVFYEEFPKLTKFSIGVPLIISFTYILIYEFECYIKGAISDWGFDAMVISLAFVGMFLIYKFSVSTLMKLKQIEG